MLEDIFWEQSITSYTHDEYYTILQTYKDNIYFQKQELLYNLTRNIKNKKYKKDYMSNYFNLKKNININMIPVYIDDIVINLNLLNSNNYKQFQFDYAYEQLDDLLDNVKYLNYIYKLNSNTILNINNSTIQPISYISILDMFRSDFEENN